MRRCRVLPDATRGEYDAYASDLCPDGMGGEPTVAAIGLFRARPDEIAEDARTDLTTWQCDFHACGAQHPTAEGGVGQYVDRSCGYFGGVGCEGALGGETACRACHIGTKAKMNFPGNLGYPRCPSCICEKFGKPANECRDFNVTDDVATGLDDDAGDASLSPPPAPASACKYLESGFDAEAGTCQYGTHISQLNPESIGKGYRAFHDQATGLKMFPVESRAKIPGTSTVPHATSKEMALVAQQCDGENECAAFSFGPNQLSRMQTTECMSPCFITLSSGSTYMAFNGKAPDPFYFGPCLSSTSRVGFAASRGERRVYRRSCVCRRRAFCFSFLVFFCMRRVVADRNGAIEQIDSYIPLPPLSPRIVDFLCDGSHFMCNSARVRFVSCDFLTNCAVNVSNRKHGGELSEELVGVPAQRKSSPRFFATLVGIEPWIFHRLYF